MKIFLYNEHAIKNTPAKLRADTVTISMRSWQSSTVTSKLGEEQRTMPEPFLAFTAGWAGRQVKYCNLIWKK